MTTNLRRKSGAYRGTFIVSGGGSGEPGNVFPNPVFMLRIHLLYKKLIVGSPLLKDLMLDVESIPLAVWCRCPL